MPGTHPAFVIKEEVFHIQIISIVFILSQLMHIQNFTRREGENDIDECTQAGTKAL